jgi:hypothetical protein
MLGWSVARVAQVHVQTGSARALPLSLLPGAGRQEDARAVARDADLQLLATARFAAEGTSTAVADARTMRDNA